MPRMTRARTASNGVVNPPPLDRWIDAVLMLFAELVQGVATTLRMWLRIRRRDWHTQSDTSALPQAKSGIQFQETNHIHGVVLGLASRISVGSARGLNIDPREAINQDSRVKPDNDSATVAATRTSPPPPNGGGAARAEPATSGFRWGTALTTRTVRTRRHTVLHLTCTRCAHLARSSSPVRGRTTPARV